MIVLMLVNDGQNLGQQRVSDHAYLVGGFNTPLRNMSQPTNYPKIPQILGNIKHVRNHNPVTKLRLKLMSSSGSPCAGLAGWGRVAGKEEESSMGTDDPSPWVGEHPIENRLVDGDTLMMTAMAMKKMIMNLRMIVMKIYTANRMVQ